MKDYRVYKSNLIRKLFFASALLSLSRHTSSQSQSPNIIPLSPTASALCKYVDVPINNYTGLENIEVPIFTVVNKN